MADFRPTKTTASSTVWANGSNGQLLTHSNHLGTHLDGEIHFYTPGKDIASLDLNEFLTGPAGVVDLSDATGDYQIYTAETIVPGTQCSGMIGGRVEVREGDTSWGVIIHTGYHHFGWDMPGANEVRYMVMHPGPDREFAEWAKAKKLRWIGVDCGSADHPMNTIVRNWMPRQARQAEAHFQKKYGKGLADVFDDSKYQLMHIEMFPYHIIHAECLGPGIDLLQSAGVVPVCNRPATPRRSAFREARGALSAVSRAQARRPPGRPLRGLCRRCRVRGDDGAQDARVQIPAMACGAKVQPLGTHRAGRGHRPGIPGKQKRLTNVSLFDS